MKRLLAMTHDTAMAALALWLALNFRYEFSGLPRAETLWPAVAAYAVIAAIVFRLLGLGRGMWRFASLTDLRTIVTASAIITAAFLTLMFVVNRLDPIPRSVPFLAWFILIVLLGAPRLGYRLWKDGTIAPFHRRQAGAKPEDVLIIGTASEADKVIRAYGLENSQRIRVHGIIDYKPNKRGRNVRGVPIVGELSELEAIIARLLRGGVVIDAAIMAAPREDKALLQPLTSAAARLQLPLRRVVATPLTGGEPNLESLTLEDLLGRPPVKIDLENIRTLIEGRRVMVTGAGGSIGSEIVRQVAQFAPSRLVILDCSEYALYEIDQTLAREHAGVVRRPVIADIRDRVRIRQVVMEERPSVVFHAAALKHVPLVEANVREGVLTNVTGSRIVADAAVEADADAFVMISTDKAIRPTSVMGAAKRAAEAYCQALDVSGVRTRFITVRFGNVLGSTGSVVPLFKRQIKAGGPVTVTHPDMRRYFMTIREATELVLQAAAHGISHPEQRGRIFVLDMGEPVKIVDLAQTMIALAGKRPHEDIAITFSGLRPGEKLFEEMFDKDEHTVPSGADGVFLANARMIGRDEIVRVLDRIENAALADDAEGVRSALAAISPELPHAADEEPPARSVRAAG